MKRNPTSRYRNLPQVPYLVLVSGQSRDTKCNRFFSKKKQTRKINKMDHLYAFFILLSLAMGFCSIYVWQIFIAFLGCAIPSLILANFAVDIFSISMPIEPQLISVIFRGFFLAFLLGLVIGVNIRVKIWRSWLSLVGW